MTTSTFYVANTNSDGCEYKDYVNYQSWAVSQNPWDAAGIGIIGRRFGVNSYPTWRIQLNIPQGATISSALLHVYALSQSGTPGVTYYAEDTDNAAQPSETNWPSNMVKTAASVYVDHGQTSWAAPGYHTVDITAILNEIVARPGFVQGNWVNLFCYSDTMHSGNDRIEFEDYSHSGGHHTYITATFETAPVVTGGPATIARGATGVVLTGNFLDTVLSAFISDDYTTEELTIVSVSNGSITLDFPALTNIAYGNRLIKVRDVAANSGPPYGGNSSDWLIEFTPVAGNGYVVIVNPALDSSSLEFEATPGGVDDDVFEWQEASIYNVNARGRYKRVAGSSDNTLTYRRWSAVTLDYSPWETLTISPDAYVANLDFSLFVNESNGANGQIDVLASASAGDWPIDATTVETVSTPLHASTFTINPTTGVITYLPDTDYAGSDEFTYRVQDTQGNWSNVAAVSITVAYRAPTADNFTSSTVAFNTAKTITLADLVNAGKVSATYAGNLSIISVAAGSHCRIAAVDTNAITLTPDHNYAGVMQATYTVQESGSNATATGTISVTVLPAVASAPHIRHFNATAQVQLTVTRTSLNDSDSVTHTVTVS